MLSSIAFVFNSIVAVTLVVPDPDSVARAYVDSLEYRAVESGQVSESVAGTWAMPPLAGRPVVLMQPKSGEPVYLRLVKDTSTVRPALRTLGWNATEILVEDPAALERRLADSSFRVIGPPAPLDMNPAVVAMQALGPAGRIVLFHAHPAGQVEVRPGFCTELRGPRVHRRARRARHPTHARLLLADLRAAGDRARALACRRARAGMGNAARTRHFRWPSSGFRSAS